MHRPVEHTNPWTTLASRRVYANPWMTVTEHDVVRPDGRPGIYGVVDARLATGVVALTDADEVVLVGQHRYPLDRWSWEIPEGGADPGEDGLAAIQRELREETGFTARHWAQLGGPVHLSNCFTSETGLLWVATGLVDDGPPDPDGTEELVRRIVPFDDALDMVDAGEITDAMSVVALLRLARQRAAG